MTKKEAEKTLQQEQMINEKFLNSPYPKSYFDNFRYAYLLAQSELQSKLDEAIEILRHYSDYTNNQDNPYDYQRARQFLSKLEKGKE